MRGAFGGFWTSAIKAALKEVYDKLGIDAAVPKMKPGKWNSPQRGSSERGYRLDPAHPRAEADTPGPGRTSTGGTGGLGRGVRVEKMEQCPFEKRKYILLMSKSCQSRTCQSSSELLRP